MECFLGLFLLGMDPPRVPKKRGRPSRQELARREVLGTANQHVVPASIPATPSASSTALVPVTEKANALARSRATVVPKAIRRVSTSQIVLSKPRHILGKLLLDAVAQHTPQDDEDAADHIAHIAKFFFRGEDGDSQLPQEVSSRAKAAGQGFRFVWPITWVEAPLNYFS